jgi:hypothetical protein
VGVSGSRAARSQREGGAHARARACARTRADPPACFSGAARPRARCGALDAGADILLVDLLGQVEHVRREERLAVDLRTQSGNGGKS